MSVIFLPISCLGFLRSTTEKRFAELQCEQINIELFVNPFNFSDQNISSLDETLQLEVIDMKCHAALRSHFNSLPPVPNAADLKSFWSLLPADKFKHLRIFAQRYLCRFGS